MIRLQQWGSLFALLPLLGGCATIINGTTQKIMIDSSPQAATATLQPGGQTVTTPHEVELERKHTYHVHYSLEGYEDTIGYIDQERSGAVAGNFLLGGLIGVAVDTSNGAAFNLTPEHLIVDLTPLPREEPAEPAQEDTAAPAAMEIEESIPAP